MNIVSSKSIQKWQVSAETVIALIWIKKIKTVVQPNRMKQMAPKRLSTENQKTHRIILYHKHRYDIFKI